MVMEDQQSGRGHAKVEGGWRKLAKIEESSSKLWGGGEIRPWVARGGSTRSEEIEES